MTTVALWHLGVSGVLAGALSTVILMQSLGDAARRLRQRAQRPVQAPVRNRPVVEPRTVRASSVRTGSEHPAAMATVSAAR